MTRAVRIESGDCELRAVLEMWLRDVGYEIADDDAGSAPDALRIVDAETAGADAGDDADDDALYLVYAETRHKNELLRPFLRADFMAAVNRNTDSGDVSRELICDSAGMSVRYRGGEVKLTEKEFAVMQLLYERGEDGASKDEIYAIAGAGNGRETNAAEVYVCMLRRKLEKLTGAKLIKTVRGRGYVLGIR